MKVFGRFHFDAEAKIIMRSAIGQQTNVMEAVKLGVRDFIVKPFEGSLYLLS